MTVILAGLYDRGAGAVIIADKMRTATHPVTGEEHEIENEEVRKIHALNDNVVVAYAGNLEFWGEIVKEMQDAVHPADKYPKVRAILERIYRKHYERYQWSKVLGFLGFTSLSDYNARAHQELPQARIDDIDRQLSGIVTSGEMVLVGKGEKVYEIYVLHDPGIFKFITYGYAIVGSGMAHGSVPVAEHYRMTLNREEVEGVLMRGKRAAESDKGVGKTELIVHVPKTTRQSQGY